MKYNNIKYQVCIRSGLMITNMREIYPDETIYSWFARYHKISGNLLAKDTIFELINCKSTKFGLYQVLGLNALCDNIHETFNYNPDYLIRNHTVFPFFKPFLSNQKSEKYIEDMKNDKCINSNAIISVSEIGMINEIKVCPQCYREDKKRYGEPYLHRVHQIFGNFVCDRHKVDLVKIKNEKYSFIDIDGIENDLYEEKAFVKEKIIRISKSLISLLNSEYLYNCTFYEIKEKYKNKLIDMGYCNREGIVHQKKLIDDFKGFYSEEFLRILNSDLGYNYNWIRTMLSNKRDRLIHPLRHILFINFIFGGVDEFEKYQSMDFKPFGVAPWPCLNLCCPHYKKDSIQNYNLKKNVRRNYFVGTFTCSICGFTYLRRGPDNLIEDRFRIGRIVSFGHLWDKRLSDIVLLNIYSLSEIARIMGVTRDTIKSQAQRLNIDIGDFSKRKVRRQEKNSKDVNKLDEYKSHILKLIKENPRIIRSEIQNTLNREYVYLYRNDRAWFEENLPKPIQIYEAMQIFSEQYWISIDNEIHIKVINAIEEILAETPSKRITKSYISKKINYLGITKPVNLNRMPITNNLLDSKCESIEQFKHRNI
jgi:hypothetical protein